MIAVTSVTLLWPLLLAAEALVPLLLLGYLALARRAEARQAGLATAGLVLPTGLAGTGVRPLRPWQRHLPALLVLAGIATLLFALTRPHALIGMPSRQQNIMLALDMSGSMRATDIKPSRMAAAQSTAKQFIALQPANTRIGIVAVAATASVVQPPTGNREELTQAIDRLQLQRGTALGSGIAISLATLLPKAGIDTDKIINGPPPKASATPPRKGEDGATGSKSAAKDAPPVRVPAGSDSAHAIVLLSDGESNTGPDPVAVAEIAATHGVRIFAIGIGTPEGATLSSDGWSMKVKLDKTTLAKIALVTQGEYFTAGSAAQLEKIYEYLSARLAYEQTESTEISVAFVALGLAFCLVGVMLSMAWFGRVV